MQGKTDHRAVYHARQLLTLIDAFPLTNPHEDDGIDIALLLRQIRSRYKALCASVGARPTLRATASEVGVEEFSSETPASALGEGGSVGKKRSVWRVEGAPASEQGLSF